MSATTTDNLYEELLKQLANQLPGGYSATGPTASEPTAWGTIALAQAGNLAAARKGAAWLRKQQSPNGAVGVVTSEETPAWTTSLAMLAWDAVHSATKGSAYGANIKRATQWTLTTEGRTTEQKPQIGHNTMLVGWSWAADTHSWLEPTAFFVRALREIGQDSHPRTREGVKMLVDRLLPTGGANYGNTRVLDQYLLPHVQPTGVVLWSLAGEQIDDPRINRSLDYLQDSLEQPLGVSSLCFALMGLTAHGRATPSAQRLLAAAANGTELTTYKLALLSLAQQAVRRKDPQ